MTTVLLDSTDIDEVESVLSAAYAKMRVAAVADNARISARICRDAVGELAADRIRYGFDLSYDMEAQDRLVLCHVRSGACQVASSNHEPRTYGPGQVFVFGTEEGAPAHGIAYHGEYDQLVLGRSAFERGVTRSTLGADARLTGAVPISPDANAHMINLIDHVRESAVRHTFATHSPLLTGALEHYVAASILTAFPHTALLELAGMDRHDSTPALLRRAIAYIDDNAHENISLSDISGAIYVTPRALQYMFRKNRDCTPMEYVRRVRLHHAHSELVAETRATHTVGQIAHRWGFAHLGRFAVYYREHYGQSPHETLRR